MSDATPCLGIDGELRSLRLDFVHFPEKTYPFYRSEGSFFKGEMLLQYSFLADWNVFLSTVFFLCKSTWKVTSCSRLHKGLVQPKHGCGSVLCFWKQTLDLQRCVRFLSQFLRLQMSSCSPGLLQRHLDAAVAQSSLLCSWQEKRVCHDRVSCAAHEAWTGIWPFAEDVWTSSGGSYEHWLFTLCR